MAATGRNLRTARGALKGDQARFLGNGVIAPRKLSKWSKRHALSRSFRNRRPMHRPMMVYGAFSRLCYGVLHRSTHEDVYIADVARFAMPHAIEAAHAG